MIRHESTECDIKLCMYWRRPLFCRHHRRRRCPLRDHIGRISMMHFPPHVLFSKMAFWNFAVCNHLTEEIKATVIMKRFLWCVSEFVAISYKLMQFTQWYVHFLRFFPLAKKPQRTKNQFYYLDSKSRPDSAPNTSTWSDCMVSLHQFFEFRPVSLHQFRKDKPNKKQFAPYG